MSIDFLPYFATYMLVLVASLTAHEWGHAASAWWLGDDTAARQGRMTFNPAAHVDPIGTLLIPALMLVTGGALPMFGWAKPVPVRSSRFTRRISLRAGEALTGAAGPAMNLLLALIATIAFGVIGALAPEWLIDVNDVEQARRPLFHLLQTTTSLNVALACFNLIPVPPLDGGWLLQWALPRRYDWVVAWLAERGTIILLIAIFGPGYLGFLAPPVLAEHLAPSSAMRVLAALALAAVSAWCFVGTRTAIREGRPGSAVGLERTAQWTFPLALAMGAAQLSVWSIDLVGDGLRGARQLIISTLAGG